MKLVHSLLITIVLYALSSSGNTYSQWSADTLGMGKKSVTKLLLLGNSMISGTTDSGIYVRASYEDKWRKINDSPQKITGLVISGKNLVAGTFDQGIFYSTNTGISWEPSIILTKKIITLFENRIYLLAGTDKGIFESTDNGITWSETSMKKATYSIAEIGKNFYAGTNKGLHVSTSLTGTWTKIFDRTTNSIIAFEDTILIANNDGTIWRKKSNENWTEVYSLGRDLYKLFNISNIVLAGTYIKGIKCSTDYGNSWQESCLDQNAYLKNSIVWDLILSGSKLYACTGHGVYKTNLRLCIEPGK